MTVREQLIRELGVDARVERGLTFGSNALGRALFVLADSIDENRAKNIPTEPFNFRLELESLLEKVESHEAVWPDNDVFLARFIRQKVKLYDEVFA